MARLSRVARARSGESASDKPSAGIVPVYGAGGQLGYTTRPNARAGNIIIGRVGSVGSLRLLTSDAWVTDNAIILSLQEERTDSRYIINAVRQIPISLITTGTAMPLVTASGLLAQSIPLPGHPDQTRIADYLDRETAQIDTLIAKQEQLIATLRERRRRIIEQAATGLFNPLAPTGQSRAIGSAYSVVLGKMLDGKHRVSSSETELPYVRAANIQDHGLDLTSVNVMPYSEIEAQRLNLLAADLLVVEGGAVGTSVLLRDDMVGWSFQKTVNRVRSLGTASTAWLGYVLRAYRDAGHIAIICDGSTIAHFTAEKLRALRIPVIEPSRQREIVAYLDEQTAKIDALIAKAERFIELSKERRAALITAAVTGQLEVPAA
ncbi:MAG: restriction endonuclease subunit S [Microbacteriaceae bacterium]